MEKTISLAGPGQRVTQIKGPAKQSQDLVATPERIKMLLDAAFNAHMAGQVELAEGLRAWAEQLTLALALETGSNAPRMGDLPLGEIWLG